MRKFQEWMDLRQYESHIKKLTTIKERSLIAKTNSQSICTHKNSKQQNKKALVKSFSTHLRTHKTENMAEEKAHIKNRYCGNIALTSSKIHNQINREPLCKLNQHNEAKKRHVDEREVKLKRFLHLKSANYISRLHKNILKIKFLAIPKIPVGNLKTFWSELVIRNQAIKSEHFSESDIGTKQICFLVSSNLQEKKCFLFLHGCRKLDYFDLGKYELRIGESPVVLESVCFPKKKITVQIQYQFGSKYRLGNE